MPEENDRYPHKLSVEYDAPHKLHSFELWGVQTGKPIDGYELIMTREYYGTDSVLLRANGTDVPASAARILIERKGKNMTASFWRKL